MPLLYSHFCLLNRCEYFLNPSMFICTVTSIHTVQFYFHVWVLISMDQFSWRCYGKLLAKPVRIYPCFNVFCGTSACTVYGTSVTVFHLQYHFTLSCHLTPNILTYTFSLRNFMGPWDRNIHNITIYTHPAGILLKWRKNKKRNLPQQR